MKSKRKGTCLFCMMLCGLIVGFLFSISKPVLAATTAASCSTSTVCSADTASGCTGGANCQTTCGSNPTCTTSTTLQNTKYTTANTSSGDGAAVVGVAVAVGILIAAVIGFLLLNRRSTRK